MAALDLNEGGQQRLGLLCGMAQGALPLDVRLDVPDMAGRRFEKCFVRRQRLLPYSGAGLPALPSRPISYAPAPS